MVRDRRDRIEAVERLAMSKRGTITVYIATHTQIHSAQRVFCNETTPQPTTFYGI